MAYLAAAGFTICFARLLFRSGDEGRYHSVVHGALACGFLLAMIPGFTRGAWLSALLTVLIMALWAGRARYALLIPLAVAVMLTVEILPASRVIPSDQQAAGGGYTSGRFDLWSSLWDKQIDPALPIGNGFGQTFSLSSEDVFGAGSTSFNPALDGSFVYPHNDFIFWMVELGLLGLFGIVLFWTQLVRAFRSVIRRAGGVGRTQVQSLAGVLVTGFAIQFVGSLFLFTALAVPFFITAGFISGSRESLLLATSSRDRASAIRGREPA
jgi:O-antigen ligase